MNKIFTLIFTVCTFLSAAQTSWVFNSTFPGTMRHAGISFSVNGKGYIGTGYSSNNLTLDDIWEYDPASAGWTQKANFPLQVYAATCFTLDSFVYVTNGWNSNTGSVNSDMYRYDPSTDSWSQVAAYPGTPAYTTVSFVINGKAYLGMGYSPLTNEIWEYDPVNDSWTAKSAYPGTLRQNASAGVINNIAYVGCGGAGNAAFNDFYAYDASTDTWTAVASLPANGRLGAMEFVLDDKLFLCGGFDLTNYLREVWAYDPFNNTWLQYPDYGGAERFQGMNFTLGNSVFVGLGRAGGYYDDFWEFTPSGANIISGIAFRDYDNNGVADSTESGFNNFLVQVSPSGNIYSTDHKGHFEASADTGTFTITPVNTPAYYTAASVSNTVNFTSTGVVDSSSVFAYVPVSATEDLAIDATALTQFRPGFTGVINLSVQNKGTHMMIQSVAEIQLPQSLSFIQVLPADSDSLSNDTLSIYIDSLAPGEIRNYQVHAMISVSLTMNDTLLISGRILPTLNDADTTDNYLALQIPVVASFDPNDIQVNPEGPVKVVDVQNGQWLTYTVRFQNTGNASAIFIRVADTIASSLDLSTLEFISSSHPCQLELHGDRVLKYFFDNINLPDSTTDLAGSNGYVKYRMKIVNTTPVGTVITNKAGIYFDYNPPVITNTASTVIYTNTGIQEHHAQSGLLIYPNPGHDEIYVKLSSGFKPVKARLYSVTGQQISCIISQEGEINVSGLLQGVYVISVEDLNGKTEWNKLLIR